MSPEIQITYGPNRIMLPLAGLTVDEAVHAVRDILNVGWTVEAYLNGTRVRRGRRILGDDRLEFMRTFGSKGASTRPGGVRIPAGAPPWITEDDIRETLVVWQRYSDSLLTEEDAVEILVNVRQVFQVIVKDE